MMREVVSAVCATSPRRSMWLCTLAKCNYTAYKKSTGSRTMNPSSLTSSFGKDHSAMGTNVFKPFPQGGEPCGAPEIAPHIRIP